MPSDLREVDRMKDVPDALNKIVDVVLAYHPKPRTKAARKRAKAQKKGAYANAAPVRSQEK